MKTPWLNKTALCNSYVWKKSMHILHMVEILKHLIWPKVTLLPIDDRTIEIKTFYREFYEDSIVNNEHNNFKLVCFLF
jgi:hypothetical protein